MKKLNKAPIIAAIGTALVSGSIMTAVHAESNPFGMTEMSQGYMQLAGVVPVEDSAKPAAKASGEMKCGAGMDMGASKKTEGSCGEGKCGAMMTDGKMKPGLEKTCGAMMKGKEGACGEMGTPAKADAEMKCGAGMKMDGGSAMDKKAMDMACGAKMK